MADELVKAETRALTKGRDVQGEIKRMIDAQLADDLRRVRLSRHMFRPDDDPAFTALTHRQQRIVRAWEEPKKLVAFGIESAAKRVESLIRAQASSGKTTINVENMTVQLPEKAAVTAAPVYVDVEAK